MKYLIVLLLSILSALLCKAQDPDPDLFQTWYLHELDIDFGNHYEIAEIDPSIFPTITFEENLNVYGEGACNTFIGTYEAVSSSLTPLTFDHTMDDCGFQNHNGFEIDYFSFLEFEMDFQITQDGSGSQLLLSHVLLSYAVFKNYPLSISDFKLEPVKIYPNPGNALIKIAFPKEPLTRMELYDLFGKRIPLDSNLEQIDISSLASGTYLLKLYGESGSVVKRIIKE
ncbi:MAG: T9SS type A sorting domain-containing protein [Bacteroidota bacterium]